MVSQGPSSSASRFVTRQTASIPIKNLSSAEDGVLRSISESDGHAPDGWKGVACGGVENLRQGHYYLRDA